MATTSIWRGTAAAPTAFAPLHADTEAEVAIVGGGITGVSLAWRLAQAGRDVVLLEARELGGGDSGHSTGNLYATLSAGLAGVRRQWDDEVARQVARSRAEAVDWIEQQVQRLGLDCGFRRCPLVRYAATPEAQGDVDAEAEACRAAGLPVRRTTDLPPALPAACGEGLVLEQQAQFHPLAYVQALAQAAAAAGARLHEHSPVRRIERDRRALHTDQGEVRAREIVLATHSPSGFHVVQAGMLPKREYGLAARCPTPFPPGIFYAEGAQRLSVRGVETAQGHFLVCVGETRKSGQHDAVEALTTLEEGARRHLKLAAFDFRWSAQNFPGADGLPYIGRDLDGTFIATGFATDGLTYGTLAAAVIADQILGRPCAWSELYRPTRFTPVKSARAVAAEAVTMVRELARGRLTPRQHEQFQGLAAGSAAVMEVDGERLAAYRDAQGRLFAVSPLCTHMKCQVHWNAVETSWDCPCHGSRFAPDGQVLSGPACEPLRRWIPEPDS